MDNDYEQQLQSMSMANANKMSTGGVSLPAPSYNLSKTNTSPSGSNGYGTARQGSNTGMSMGSNLDDWKPPKSWSKDDFWWGFKPSSTPEEAKVLEGSISSSGIKAEGGFPQASMNGYGLGLEGTLARAGVQSTIDNSGLNIGAGATGAGIAGTIGEFEKHDANDSFARVGATASIGYGGRLHWGDSDGDGYREYGMGADAGPLSLDWKTEDPLGSILSFCAGPISGPLIADYIYDGNLTESTYEGITGRNYKKDSNDPVKAMSEVAGSVKSGITGAYNSAKSMVGY